MADLFKRIAARLFGSGRPPEWLTLPTWHLEPLFDVSAMSNCCDPQVRVDLSTYTCSVELCAPHRSAAPLTLGRCSPHVARAITAHSPREWNPITLQLLASCDENHGFPLRCEGKLLSNGGSKFVALYDVERGYVQLYGPLTGDRPASISEYDTKQERWTSGKWTFDAVRLTKAMRPWITKMNQMYRH